MPVMSASTGSRCPSFRLYELFLEVRVEINVLVAVTGNWTDVWSRLTGKRTSSRLSHFTISNKDPRQRESKCPRTLPLITKAPERYISRHPRVWAVHFDRGMQGLPHPREKRPPRSLQVHAAPSCYGLFLNRLQAILTHEPYARCGSGSLWKKTGLRRCSWPNARSG